MNVTTGEVSTDQRKGRTGADVLRFFKQIDASVPRGLGVHVVLDDCGWWPTGTGWTAPLDDRKLMLRSRRR
jgi:hypothetical protein